MRRPRWRAYLLLSRISNLPTVCSNVIAGTSLAGATGAGSVAGISAAISLLYTSGMFLNDACDEAFDREHRPDRPVPSGDVASAEAFGVGFALLALGELAVARISIAALPWALALGAAIVYYSYRHKRNAVAPLVMGACRGLVYPVAAVAASGTVRPTVLVAALALMGYVAALTQVAKRIGPRAGVVMPLLVAGISLVDAGLILAAGGSAGLAAAAAVGFVLTLLLQRVVPGT